MQNKKIMGNVVGVPNPKVEVYTKDEVNKRLNDINNSITALQMEKVDAIEVLPRIAQIEYSVEEISVRLSEHAGHLGWCATKMELEEQITALKNYIENDVIGSALEGNY